MSGASCSRHEAASVGNFFTPAAGLCDTWSLECHLEAAGPYRRHEKIDLADCQQRIHVLLLAVLRVVSRHQWMVMGQFGRLCWR